MHYLNRVSISENHRILALEGNLRVIIFYKWRTLPQSKVASLKCITIRATNIHLKICIKRKNKRKRKRQIRGRWWFHRERQRWRERDRERENKEKHEMWGREEAVCKRAGDRVIVTQIWEKYHDIYLTISHASLSWFPLHNEPILQLTKWDILEESRFLGSPEHWKACHQL